MGSEMCIRDSYHNECITQSPNPSAESEECKFLHSERPDMKNLTVHLFSENGHFNKTCYPIYSDKGWCSTRPPGDFVNKIPTEDKDWGFCSNDQYQDMCNTRLVNITEDDTPYTVTLLKDGYCFEQLKAMLEIDIESGFESGFDTGFMTLNPGEIQHRFRERFDDAQTVCVGQFHQRSFENDRFMTFSNDSYVKLDITAEYKVNIIKFIRMI